MTLYAISDGKLVEQTPSSFEDLAIRERADLQRLLRQQPGAFGEDLKIIAEEFGSWEDSRRRIDLLALDRNRRLVVIELKRGDDGSHMELQALRYAAMVAPMTFDQVVEAYSRSQDQNGDPEAVDGLQDLLEFLGQEDADDVEIADDVRIILAAQGFSREITTTVLWLNEFENMDIRCMKLVPYTIGGETYIDIQQLIPLPEAADYQIRVRNKEAAQRRVAERPDNRDWTQYQVIVDGKELQPMRKRQAVRTMIKELDRKGVPLAEIAAQLPEYGLRAIPGRIDDQSALTAALTTQYGVSNPSRWFVEDPLHDDTATWVVYRMWKGGDTVAALQSLSEGFPDRGVSFRVAT